MLSIAAPLNGNAPLCLQVFDLHAVDTCAFSFVFISSALCIMVLLVTVPQALLETSRRVEPTSGKILSGVRRLPGPTRQEPFGSVGTAVDLSLAEPA